MDDGAALELLIAELNEEDTGTLEIKLTPELLALVNVIEDRLDRKLHKFALLVEQILNSHPS